MFLNALSNSLGPKSLLFAAAYAAMLFGSLQGAPRHQWNYLGGTRTQRTTISGDSSSSGKLSWDCGAASLVDGMCRVFIQNGAWILFDSLDVRCGLSGFSVKAGNGNGGAFLLRLNSLTSSPVCTLTIPRTNFASDSFIVCSTAVRPGTGSGVHKAYLTFTSSGYGVFVYSEFTTICRGETSRDTNWIPKGIPATGDSILFPTPPFGARDTIKWDLDIAPSYFGLEANRSVAILFDSLQRKGVDTLHVGVLHIHLGHLVVPSGFVIKAGAADTNGVALSENVYASLSCRFGTLAYGSSVGGGGKLLVGPNAGVFVAHGNHGRPPVVPARVYENSIIIGSGKAGVSSIGLFDVKGTMVRRARAVNTLSTCGLAGGFYVLRAVIRGRTGEWKVMIRN